MGRSLSNLVLLARAGALITLSLVVFNVWRTGGEWARSLTSALSGALGLSSAPTRVEPHTLVLQQIRGVSELTTAVMVTEAVVPTQSDRVLGPYVIGTTRLLYIAHGEVKAGIDLSALTASNITLGEQILEIRLPPPQILDSKIDVERSRVYDYDRGFLSLGPDVAPELQTLAQRETLDRLLVSACDHGLLDQANERAVVAVSKLFESTGQYQTVSVIPQPTSPETCLQSQTQ